MHLIAVHETAGASNPLGTPAYYDRIPFAPYYLFKDLITIFLFMFGLSIFVFFMPNVLGDSVIAMFASLVILMVLPKTDLGITKGLQFRPLSKIAFYLFVTNFLLLLQLGAKHVESPFIEFGQISTALYFAYYLVIMPVVSILENTLIDLSQKGK
ncbi:cytochrome b/b6 [Melampsora americana]|nr:cytochrome b/b6 [Melampsora americana]